MTLVIFLKFYISNTSTIVLIESFKTAIIASSFSMHLGWIILQILRQQLNESIKLLTHLSYTLFLYLISALVDPYS